MSDSAGVLSVEINGKDVNLSALLERIEQQLQKADVTGKRTGESLGSSVGAGAQRGASGALSLQQALSRLDVQEAKLARAQGDTARAAEFEAQAEERLRSALAQVDTTTVQTVNAQRQLASIQTQNANSEAARAWWSWLLCTGRSWRSCVPSNRSLLRSLLQICP